MNNMLSQLIDNGVLQLGVFETIYMTFISTFFSYLIGLPLGIFLSITDKGGICALPWLNKLLGFVVNIFRSIPFVILMIAVLPAAKLIVGTSLGNKAMIVTLIIAAIPYVARMVESSIKEVDRGVIEAAQSMGTSSFKIVFKVLIPEAKPSLLVGSVISLVTILGYSAMAGTIGGGGLGKIAINYGYYRYKYLIMIAAVILLIILVQIFQSVGTKLAAKADKRLKK